MHRPVVLLTRPAAQSEAFARQLRQGAPGGERAVEIVISPMLRIEGLGVDPQRLAALPGVVLTSVNAVGFAGPGAGREALCVGPATAEAARAAGFEVTEGPGDAEGLLQMLPPGSDLVHLHGRHVARDLPVAGIAVYDQQAMDLTPAALAAIRAADPLILPLFSPRSAALLAARLPADLAGQIRVVSISAATDAAWTGPARTRRIATAKNAEAMLAAVLALLREQKPGEWVEAPHRPG